MTQTAEIYTKPGCSYCVQAKALMDRNDISYTEHNVSEAIREQLIERVTKATGSEPRTLPQIFLEGEYIGGYTELAKHLKNAK